MKPDTFYNLYFADETRGFYMMRKFYHKYADLLSRSEFPSFDDFRNQIYINLSDLNLDRATKTKEGYCIGAIKIQCRVQLEKALKEKVMLSESQMKREPEDNLSPIERQPDDQSNNPEEQFNVSDLFREITLFRLQLRDVEKKVLNHLIDGMERPEMAKDLHLNTNTLDTHIRRIRLKLIAFLEERGFKTELKSRIKRP